MRTVFALTRKELEQYFASPVAYVVVTLFLVLISIFFYVYLQEYIRFSQAAAMQGGGENFDVTQSIMRPFFANCSFFFLLIFPLLTMRLFAEEKKMGTYELLMTSPVTIPQMILGKFLGALSFLALILLLLSIYPIILVIYANPDPGPILTGFLGLLLIGAALLSVGIFCSSVTENQLVAAILALVMLVILWILNFVTRSEAWYGRVAQYASLYQRFDDFTQGILKLNDAVYYITFAFFALFVTGIVLHSQRWRT